MPTLRLILFAQIQCCSLLWFFLDQWHQEGCHARSHLWHPEHPSVILEGKEAINDPGDSKKTNFCYIPSFIEIALKNRTILDFFVIVNFLHQSLGRTKYTYICGVGFIYDSQLSICHAHMHYCFLLPLLIGCRPFGSIELAHPKKYFNFHVCLFGKSQNIINKSC